MSRKCLHGMYFQIDGSNPCFYCKRQGLSGPSNLPSQLSIRVDQGVMTDEEVRELETYPSEKFKKSGRWVNVFHTTEWTSLTEGKGRGTHE